jgi:hypothetical protein
MLFILFIAISIILLFKLCYKLNNNKLQHVLFIEINLKYINLIL